MFLQFSALQSMFCVNAFKRLCSSAPCNQCFCVQCSYSQTSLQFSALAIQCPLRSTFCPTSLQSNIYGRKHITFNYFICISMYFQIIQYILMYFGIPSGVRCTAKPMNSSSKYTGPCTGFQTQVYYTLFSLSMLQRSDRI